MKQILLVFLLLAFSHVFSQEDYTLRIDGKAVPVALDKAYEILINGKKVMLTLQANDTLTYSDDVLSFKYPKGFNVTKMKVEEGVEQLLVMTAAGSGLIIQKYTTLNPTMLKEMMLSEATKESMTYGYSQKREDYARTLASGEKLEVLKAVLTYKEDRNVYEVATTGKKDEGLLVMTISMGAPGIDDKPGRELISLMWKTLKIN